MSLGQGGFLPGVNEAVRRAIADLKKRLAAESSRIDEIVSSESTVDHGSLLGRGDDDHTLYALSDGTRGNFEAAGAAADAEVAANSYADSLIETEQTARSDGDAATLSSAQTYADQAEADAVTTAANALTAHHAPTSTDHDERYYTEAEVDSLDDSHQAAAEATAAAALTAHHAASSTDHDDRYYTETEADDRFVNAAGDTMTGMLEVDLAAVPSNAMKFSNSEHGFRNMWFRWTGNDGGNALVLVPSDEADGSPNWGAEFGYEFDQQRWKIDSDLVAMDNVLLSKAPTVSSHATRKDYVDTADAILQDNIDAEEAARIAADALLQQQIDDHLDDVVGAHAASAISYDGSSNSVLVQAWLTANNLQTAVGQLAGQLYTPDAETTQALIDALNALAVGAPIDNEDIFSSDLIVSRHLASGSVIAGKIDAQAVTAGTIAADAVTGTEISASSHIVVGTGATTWEIIGTDDPLTSVIKTSDATWVNDTGVYLDASGRFRLGDQLSYVGGVLTIGGTSAGSLADTSYVDTQASAAQSAAEATASADATTKADAAETNAVSTAASDATSKANAAETAAKAYTDDSFIPANINPNVTAIDGGVITTGTVNTLHLNASEIRTEILNIGLIEADEIDVTDLDALNATIGGWTINSTSISAGSTVLSSSGDITLGSKLSYVASTGALDVNGAIAADEFVLERTTGDPVAQLATDTYVYTNGSWTIREHALWFPQEGSSEPASSQPSLRWDNDGWIELSSYTTAGIQGGSVTVRHDNAELLGGASGGKVAATDNADVWLVGLNILMMDYGSSATNVDINGSVDIDGTLKMGDGSEASPSITFAGDTDSGIYRETSGQWRLVSNGTSKFKIGTQTNHSYQNLDMNGNNIGGAGEVYSETGWFRTQTSGKGFYMQAHGVGIMANDNDWVRSYGCKGFWGNTGAGGGLATTSTSTGYQYMFWSTATAAWHRFTSTRDAKERIQTMKPTGDIIDGLRPVTFIAKRATKVDSEEGPHEWDAAAEEWRLKDIEYGFIAEEVAEVADGQLAQYDTTEDGGLKPSGWSLHGVLAVAVAEIKSLRARVAELEERCGV